MKEIASDQENPAWLGEAALQESSLLERASAPTLRDLRAAAGELLALLASSSTAGSTGCGREGRDKDE